MFTSETAALARLYTKGILVMGVGSSSLLGLVLYFMITRLNLADQPGFSSPVMMLWVGGAFLYFLFMSRVKLFMARLALYSAYLALSACIYAVLLAAEVPTNVLVLSFPVPYVAAVIIAAYCRRVEALLDRDLINAIA